MRRLQELDVKIFSLLFLCFLHSSAIFPPCLTGLETRNILHNLWLSDLIILACGSLGGRADLGGGNRSAAVSFLRGAWQRADRPACPAAGGKEASSAQAARWERILHLAERCVHYRATVGGHRWSVPSGVSQALGRQTQLHGKENHAAGGPRQLQVGTCLHCPGLPGQWLDLAEFCN